MSIMRQLFHLLLSAAVISTASAQNCEAPSQGCTYGMWSFEKCLCECIKPFCPDANGDCVVPLDNCGGNPWAGCIRGVNCPWWGSLSSSDMCNTGENVPPGVWEIFNTREICCGVHAPFSTVCETKGPNGRPLPSNAPTIALPLVSDTEEVALKFDLSGLPNDVDMPKLKANVLVALKIILASLKERVPDLKVSQIRERLCYGRRLDERRQLRMTERELLRRASICYVIEVVDKGNIQDYERLIVSEARDSSNVVLDQIRTKLNYVNVGMYLVGISDGSGGSSGSGVSMAPGNGGTIFIDGGGGNGGSSPGDGTIYINGEGPGNPGILTIEKGGIPGWGVALLVILLLILFCCIGYWIFVSCRNSKDDKYAVNVLFNKQPASRASNNRKGNPPRSQYKRAPPSRRRSFSFSNVRDRSRRRDDGRTRSRYESFRSSFQRSQRPRRARSQGATKSRRDENYPTISLSNPQDPKFGADAFTVNTYMTEKKSALDPSMKAMVVYNPDYAKPDPSQHQSNHAGRDPSLYQSNNTKPDPEGETADTIVLALTNGEEYARDDPSTKSKLEPEEVLLIESAPLDGSHRYRRSSSRGTIGTLDGSNSYRRRSSGGTLGTLDGSLPMRRSSSRGTLDPSVNGDDDYYDYEANDLYDKYEEYIFGRYAPKSQNDRKDVEVESSSLTTNDLEEELERRTKKKSKKKKKKHRDGGESKKTYEENSTPESSERYRVYKEVSGVESVESGGENRSIEESRASA